MIIFDDIHVDYPLPDGCPLTEFQTEDLDGNIDRYRITSEGRLLVERMEDRHTEENHEVEIDDFDGHLFFHSNDPATSNWWEFRAYFENGQLEEIILWDYYELGDDNLPTNRRGKRHGI